MKQQLSKRGINRRVKWSIFVLGLVALVGITLAVLQSRHVIHLFSTPAVQQSNGNSHTGGENTKGQTGLGGAISGSQGGTNGSSNGNGTGTSQTVLLTPTGNFVSDHHPNLSGSPAPNTMESVCNTTSGATCQVTFTNVNTGVVKSLATQLTDTNGAAYWHWKLQDIGLTQGNWKITAIARLNNKTKSTVDALNLDVGP